MIDPKEHFTEDGYDEYRMHLKNLENALFFLSNNADDLWLDSDDDLMQAIYSMETQTTKLKDFKGPFETRDD